MDPGACPTAHRCILSASLAAPDLLDALLSHIADQIATYVKYQIDSGADCVMMFDSWGGQVRRPPCGWPRSSRRAAAASPHHPLLVPHPAAAANAVGPLVPALH